jgi:hypothetical protein
MPVLACLAYWLLLGGIAGLAFFRRRRWDLGVAVMPFAGAIALASPWTVSAMLGTRVSGTFGWAWQAAAAALLLWGLAELLAWRAGGRDEALQPDRGGWAAWYVAGILVAMVVTTSIFTGLVFSRGYPGYLWDAFSVWLARTRQLADLEVFPNCRTASLSLRMAGSNWPYPLVHPSILGWFHRAAGLPVYQLAIPIGLVAGLFPLAIWVALSRRIGPGWAGVVALVPFAVAKASRYHHGGYADAILAMAASSALALGLAGIRDRDRCTLLLGGFVMATAALTKNEGLLWLVASCLGIGLFALDTRLGWKRSIEAVARFAVPTIVLLGLWKAAAQRAGVPSYLNDIRYDNIDIGERLPVVVKAVLEEFGHTAAVILWVPALVVMAVLPRGRWLARLRRIATLLVCPLIYVLGVVLVFLVLHFPVEWLIRTGLDRAMFSIPPALVAAAVFGRSPPQRPSLSGR